MTTIYINGYAHNPDDLVTWEDAIEHGGFYFSRARYLGIERPMAILFDEDNPRYQAAMARYHKKFVAAETRQIADMMDEMDDFG